MLLCTTLLLTLGCPGAPGAPPPPVSNDNLSDALGQRIEALAELEETHRARLGRAATTIGRDIDRAADAVAAGLWPAAVLPYGRAFRELHLVSFLVRTAELDAQGLEAFDAAWREQELAFEELAPRDRLAAHGPDVVAALEEVSSHRAWRYFHSSRAYAGETGVGSGRYYLGRGRANAELAASLRTLPGRDRAPHGSPHPGALLESLEADLSKLFRPPLSETAHGDFVQWSSELEQARELERAGAPLASLLQALEVRQALEAFRSDGTDPDAEQLDEALLAHERQLSEAEGDTSLGTALLQRASWRLDEANSGRAGALEEAAAVLGPVFEAYLAAQVADEGAVDEPHSAELTVTLVRWPFT